MNTTKTLIAGAAVAGLMAGSLPVRAYAASSPSQAGVSLQTLAEKESQAPTPAREKTPAKAKAAARLVTPVAKAKIPVKAKAVAPLTAASPSN